MKHIDPSNAVILVLLAVTITYGAMSHARNSVWTDGYILWKDTIMKSPFKTRGYVYLGITYAEDHRFEEAEKNIRRALEIDPYNVEALYNLSVLMKDTGRYTEAVRGFKRCISLRPDLLEPYLGLARVYIETGRLQDALSALKRAERTGHASPPQLLSLKAEALAKAGYPERAEKILNELLESDPYDYAALNGMGNIKFMEGRLEEAAGYYKKAIEISPLEAEPLYNVAMVLERLGRTNEAVNYYERFISMKPKGYEAAVEAAAERVRKLKGGP